MVRLNNLLEEVCAGAEIFFSSGYDGFNTTYVLCDDYGELLAKFFLHKHYRNNRDYLKNLDTKSLEDIHAEVLSAIERPQSEQDRINEIQLEMLERREQIKRFSSVSEIIVLRFNRDDCVEAFCDVFTYGHLLFGNEWNVAVQGARQLGTYRILFALENTKNDDVRGEYTKIVQKSPLSPPHQYVVPSGEELHMRLAITREKANLRLRLEALLARSSDSIENTSTQENTMERSQVFISYSHKDKKFLEELETHLAPYIRNHKADVWADTRIQAGSNWQDEIKTALERAKVAVLLVSPNFLRSQFIMEEELPHFFEAAKAGGLTILWVLLYDCAYEETFIKDIQAAISPSRPLAPLPPGGRAVMWKAVCQTITNAAS